LLWGVALGVAAFAAFFVARTLVRNAVLAFIAAFVAFEAVLVLFSIPLGGWEAYAPRYTIEIFAVNAAWFIGAQTVLRLAARRPVLGAP